jgi:lipoprotein NlpD
MVIGCFDRSGILYFSRLTGIVKKCLPVFLALVATAFIVSGCSNALRWSPEYHVVEPGESLYSIAWRYGLDYRELAAWNNLGSGSLIYPGQRIKLSGQSVASTSSKSAPQRTAKSGSAAPAPGKQTRAPPASVKPVGTWRWPTSGSVAAGFGATPQTESGIQISGKFGQPITAAAGGEVVYSGSGLVGLGQVLIIKHNSNYLSAYGYNEDLLVGEGDKVSAGQKIAHMGRGPGQRSLLHFEIRRDGQPVNPLKYLPSR